MHYSVGEMPTCSKLKQVLHNSVIFRGLYRFHFLFRLISRFTRVDVPILCSRESSVSELCSIRRLSISKPWLEGFFQSRWKTTFLWVKAPLPTNQSCREMSPLSSFLAWQRTQHCLYCTLPLNYSTWTKRLDLSQGDLFQISWPANRKRFPS